MLKVTKSQLIELRPCDLERRLALFGQRKSLDAKQALEAGATIPDVLWVAAKLGRKDLCVRFALACAQRVAHLNSDPRVQAALDAAQTWLDDPSERNRLAAAYAANAAANAAAYAAYAAYAANAAAYAAYAAAYAANAAAANAAYAANAAAERLEQRRIFLEIFGKGSNHVTKTGVDRR